MSRDLAAALAGMVVTAGLGAAYLVATSSRPVDSQRTRAAKVAPMPVIPDVPTITAKPRPKPDPQPAPEPPGHVNASSVWLALAACETGGGLVSAITWDYNGPSGYDGGLQFSPGTWTAHKPEGAPAYAWQATPAQQIAAGESARAAAGGFGPWPGCAAKLGLPT